MKFKFFALLLSQLVSGSVLAQSQRQCGTMENLEYLRQSDPGLDSRMIAIEEETERWMQNNPNAKASAVITIPVVVHVVWNTAAQNISDARIIEQINVLNEDFRKMNADTGNVPAAFKSLHADCEIEFCLATKDPNGNATTGITRTQTSTTSFSSNNAIKFTAQGGKDAWSSGSYLNFWVGNLSGGLLGYAQFPGGSASTDGIVCLYSSVGGPAVPGTAYPYHLGRTAVHEAGHWLNLRHIWGDSNCGNDFVSDTPTQQTANFGCPAFPHVTCGNGPNGDMFMNYMDYVYDACMVMFSEGQKARMIAALNGPRISIQSSQGCAPTVVCGVDSFEPNDQFAAAEPVSFATDYLPLICPASDADWFVAYLTQPNKHLKFTLSSLPANYDLEVYNSSQQLIAGSYRTGTKKDSVIVNNAAVGNYYVKVFGAGGAFHASDSYKLRANKKSTPYRLNENDCTAENMTLSISPNPAIHSAIITVDGTESSVLNIQVIDVSGRIVKESRKLLENEAQSFTLDVSMLRAGAYYIFCFSDEQVAKARMIVLNE